MAITPMEADTEIISLQTPYEILDVPRDATFSTIKSHYRKLILACHPDRVKDESANHERPEKFYQVQEAYEILRDETRRQRYDEKCRYEQLRAETKDSQRPEISKGLYSYPSRADTNSYYSNSHYYRVKPASVSISKSGSNDSGYATDPLSSPRASRSKMLPPQGSPAQDILTPRPRSSISPYLSPDQHEEYTFGRPKHPDLEVFYSAPRSASKRERRPKISTRSSSPSPSSPSEYPCLYPGCGHISSRAFDLRRHMTVHFPPELLDCKYEWCGRTGANGFKREDHRKEHYRKVHGKTKEHREDRRKWNARVIRGKTEEHREDHRKEPDRKVHGKVTEHTKEREGRRPASEISTTILPSPSRVAKSPIQREATAFSSLPGEQGVSPTGDPQVVRPPAENPSLPGSIPIPETAVEILDQEGIISKGTAPSPGLRTPKRLAATAGLFDEKPNSLNSVSTEVDEPLPMIFKDIRLDDLPTPMSLIESQVLVGLLPSWQADQYCASLQLQWDPLAFMDEQFCDYEFPNTALSTVITISGTIQHAQAATCSEYIRQNWPAHGSTVLDALQNALNNPNHTSKTILAVSSDGVIDLDHVGLSNHSELEFFVAQGIIRLNVKSKNPRVIVDVVQQLAWMGTALRTSANGRAQYYEPKLVEVSKGKRAQEPVVFNMTFDMNSSGQEEQSCWLPLFANPVIAQGFPVPARENGEQGLEIPLEIMAALGGARHMTDFEGGLILKGYSVMFVPVKRHHQSIQWHLIRREDEQRIFYREVNECLERTMLDEVDYDSVQGTRAFLGWWKSAETHLGTADADYGNINWSPADAMKRSPKVSGANIGFQTMITGQLSFSMGAKDGRLHFSQKGPFQKTLQCATKTPMCLYDLGDRRAWLVSSLDVILHIIQTRHHLSPYNIDGKLVELTPVTPSSGEAAATEAIAANRQRQLYERDAPTEDYYTYKDAILDIWSQIERLMEKEGSIEASAGLALRGTMRSKIYGWEYMSIVHEKNYRRKEAVVEKSNGGWVDLVSDIDALVLFASGLGEIIRPVSELGKLCHLWRNLPIGKDFLATSIPIMEQLYSEAGSRYSRNHLTTSHLQWNRGSTLFEQCSGKASCCHQCDRTQQIYHDCLFKTLGHVRQPGKLEENGCVVFGRMHHPLKPHKKMPKAQNAVHMLPNTPIQDSEATKQDLKSANYLLSPSPTTTFSTELRVVNGLVIHAPGREPLRPNTPNYLKKERILATKMLHNHTSSPPETKGFQRGEDQISLHDSCRGKTPAKQLDILATDTQPNGQDMTYQQTEHDGRSEHIPMQTRKTVRRRAKFEGCSHFMDARVQDSMPSNCNYQAEPHFAVLLNGTRRNSAK